MVPFVRTVTTKSGWRGVQIVWSRRGTKRDLVHVGSARTDAEYEILLQAARQQMAARVRNGGRWTVTGVRDNGSLIVRRANSRGTVFLPAGYVSYHVDLG